jgi:hypothetical protein
MDFHSNDPGGGCEDDGGLGLEGIGDAAPCATSGGISELLAEPIVQALMAADGVDRNGLEALLCRVAARRSDREAPARRRRSW